MFGGLGSLQQSIQVTGVYPDWVFFFLLAQTHKFCGFPSLKRYDLSALPRFKKKKKTQAEGLKNKPDRCEWVWAGIERFVSKCDQVHFQFTRQAHRRFLKSLQKDANNSG